MGAAARDMAQSSSVGVRHSVEMGLEALLWEMESQGKRVYRFRRLAWPPRVTPWLEGTSVGRAALIKCQLRCRHASANSLIKPVPSLPSPFTLR